MKKILSRGWLRAGLLAAPLAGLVSVQAAEVTGTQYAMGTILTVRLEGRDSGALKEVRDRMFEDVRQLEFLLSLYKNDSDVARINRKAGEYVAVSTRTVEAIQEALNYAGMTGGAFDPTVGSVIHVWGFDSDHPKSPRPEDIQRAAAVVNFREVDIQEGVPSVRLRRPGMRLDFGGIGKGIALDDAERIARRSPAVKRCVMNFGGQVQFWQRDGFRPERVIINRPDDKKAVLAEILVSSSCSIATSSNAERRVTLPNPLSGSPEEYGHLMNPWTGWPARGIESVTVIAPTGTEADALTKAPFVLGLPRAMEFLKEHPEVEALIAYIDREGQFRTAGTPGWNRFVQH